MASVDAGNTDFAGRAMRNRTTLNLAGKLNNAQMKTISDALRTNKSIKIVIITQAYMSNESGATPEHFRQQGENVDYLMRALEERGVELEALDLSTNGWAYAAPACIAVADALARGKLVIRDLDLSGQSLGDAPMAALRAAVDRNTMLLEINAPYDGFKSGSGKAEHAAMMAAVEVQ